MSGLSQINSLKVSDFETLSTYIKFNVRYPDLTLQLRSANITKAPLFEVQYRA